MSFSTVTPVDEVQYAVEIPLVEDSNKTQLILATDYEDAVEISKRYAKADGSTPPLKTRRILVTQWMSVE